MEPREQMSRCPKALQVAQASCALSLFVPLMWEPLRWWQGLRALAVVVGLLLLARLLWSAESRTWRVPSATPVLLPSLLWFTVGQYYSGAPASALPVSGFLALAFVVVVGALTRGVAGGWDWRQLAAWRRADWLLLAFLIIMGGGALTRGAEPSMGGGEMTLRAASLSLAYLAGSRLARAQSAGASWRLLLMGVGAVGVGTVLALAPARDVWVSWQATREAIRRGAYDEAIEHWATAVEANEQSLQLGLLAPERLLEWPNREPQTSPAATRYLRGLQIALRGEGYGDWERARLELAQALAQASDSDLRGRAAAALGWVLLNLHEYGLLGERLPTAGVPPAAADELDFLRAVALAKMGQYTNATQILPGAARLAMTPQPGAPSRGFQAELVWESLPVGWARYQTVLGAHDLYGMARDLGWGPPASEASTTAAWPSCVKLVSTARWSTSDWQFNGASYLLLDHEVKLMGQRGYNLAVLGGPLGLIALESFDTWQDSAAGERLLARINTLDDGDTVAVFTHATRSGRFLGESGRRALEMVGATHCLGAPGVAAHALIGVKRAGGGRALMERVGERVVELAAVAGTPVGR